MTHRLLNTKQVMEVVGVKCAETIYGWRKAGKIPEPVRQANGSFLWDWNEWEKFLKGDRVKPKSKIRDPVYLDSLKTRLGDPNQVFTGQQILDSRGIVVYAWIREDEVLYIGKSIHGLARPLHPYHERLRDKDILPMDLLYLWHFSTREEAEKVELELIAQFRPKLNHRII